VSCKAKSVVHSVEGRPSPILRKEKKRKEKKRKEKKRKEKLSALSYLQDPSAICILFFPSREGRKGQSGR